MEKVALISLIVLAVYATMIEGNIFGFVRKFGNVHWPEWLQKIVYDCYICMVAYYGSLAYFLIYRNSFKEWIITVIAAMGLNTVVYFISNKD